MVRFKSILGSICISLLFVGLYCSSAFSATLIVEDGQLMGATDVLVNGVSYDVEFLDGSADDLYSDGVDFTFTFTTATDALAASTALLDQVFLDVTEGRFDSEPEKTNGGIYTLFKYVYTPYEISANSDLKMNVAYALNYADTYGHDDTIGVFLDVNLSNNTSSMSGQVFAVWSSSNSGETSPVPIPSAILLLGSGLLSLAGLRRKKHFNKV